MKNIHTKFAKLIPRRSLKKTAGFVFFYNVVENRFETRAYIHIILIKTSIMFSDVCRSFIGSPKFLSSSGVYAAICKRIDVFGKILHRSAARAALSLMGIVRSRN